MIKTSNTTGQQLITYPSNEQLSKQPKNSCNNQCPIALRATTSQRSAIRHWLVQQKFEHGCRNLSIRFENCLLLK
jgi:hypothetical protein